jgi:branched-chain amino acid transport system substrate-binding protein
VRLPRRLVASVIVSTLLGGAAACDSSDSGGRTAVVIGADLAVNSTIDAAFSRALQLRVGQINASGLLGKRRLTLRIQDSRSDPTSSLRNISTFADDPAVAAIITGRCDQCAVDAAKTVNNKGVPLLALAAATEVGSPAADRRWTFKVGPNAVDSSAALVAELTAAKTDKVAVLYSDDLYGRSANAAFGARLTKAGVKVAARQSIKPTASDVSQPVSTLLATKPDALLVLVPPDQAILAGTSAGAAKFRGRIFLDAGAAGDLFLPPAAAIAMENATMVFTPILAIDDVVATTPAKVSRKQWFRDYTAQYGTYSGVAAFAADAADLIADAVAQVGGDRARIRDILETSQTDGFTGAFRFSPDNHSGLTPQSLALLVARNGRWRIAGSELTPTEGAPAR